MEDRTELKPCPFCGSEARIFYTMELGVPTGYEGARVTIRCTNTSECGAQISKWAAKKAWSKASAIKAWNRRTTDERKEK